MLLAAHLAATLVLAPPADRPAVEVRPRIQLGLRYEWDDRDAPNGELRPFRARFGLAGRVGKALRARVSVGVEGIVPSLENAYLDWRVVGKHLQVRAGRFKRPFSRVRLISMPKLSSAARTFVDDRFRGGRDVGIMLHSGLKRGSGLEWAAGGFYLDRAAAAARIGWSSKGTRGYSETDRAGGPVRFGGAAAALWQAGTDDEDPAVLWEADLVLKLHGLALLGQVWGSHTEAVFTVGAYGNAAWRFFGPLEVTARWAMSAPSPGRTEMEASAGLNAWLLDDHLLLSLDGSWLRRPTPGSGALRADAARVRASILVR